MKLRRMLRSSLFILLCATSLALLPYVGLPYYALRELALLTQYGYGPITGDIFDDSGQQLGAFDTTAVALGDLDGDGDLDAFTAHWEQRNSVWFNNGLGIFSDSEQRLGIGVSQSEDIALGDLDGDDDLDAIVVNGYGAQQHEVWLNNGSGSFVSNEQILGWSDAKTVALGDLDNDGDLDAFIGTWSSDANEVWMNDGQGQFTRVVLQFTGTESWGVALGDLDGDDDLDAFVANYKAGDEIWLNDGTGDFVNSEQRLGAFGSHEVALGDLDDDGDLDAFVASVYTWEPGTTSPNQIWLNNGSGSFTNSGQNLGNEQSETVALGDIDLDGDLDTAIGNVWNQPDQIWLNNGSGVFTDTDQQIGKARTTHVALGDLDGDSDLDLFLATGDSDTPDQVWFNQLRQPLFSIAGRITDQNNDPIAGVTVTTGSGQSATTTNAGTYSIQVPAGVYTLTPTKDGMTFAPSSRMIDVPPDVVDQNFTATVVMSTVAGRVVDIDGEPVAGVTIATEDGDKAITDSNGDYSIADLPVGSYTLTPAKVGLTFTPSSRSITVPLDLTDQDFTAHPEVKGSMVFLPLMLNGVETPPPVMPSPTVTATPTATDDFVTGVVDRTNYYRRLHDCPALNLNAQLTSAAQRHSDDMALHDFLSHTGSDGSSPWDRINDVGYSFSFAAENAAAGYSDPESVVDEWYNETPPNDGHRRNILNCDLQDIGVGYAQNPNTTYRYYWTQKFASP